MTAVTTLALALWIMFWNKGLSDNLDFGAGAYYYADIPNFEEYETRGITTSIPYWVYVALFLAWGFLMILLFLWVSKARKGKQPASLSEPSTSSTPPICDGPLPLTMPRAAMGAESGAGYFRSS